MSSSAEHSPLQISTSLQEQARIGTPLPNPSDLSEPGHEPSISADFASSGSKAILNLEPSSSRSTLNVLNENFQASRRSSEPSVLKPLNTHTRRRSNVDPAEAVRRGLSFGPLPQAAERGKPQSKSSVATVPPAEGTLGEDADQSVDENVVASLQTEPSSRKKEADEGPEETPLEEERGRGRAVKRPTEELQSPVVTVTEPSGHLTTSKTFSLKNKKRPATSSNVESVRAPTETDYENLNDIREAQRIGMVSSYKEGRDRCLETLLRGNFKALQDEESEGNIGFRSYFLAANLKEEAFYAITYTIGTVLRDGDTLMIMYAMQKDLKASRTENDPEAAENRDSVRQIPAEIDELTHKAARKPSLFAGVKDFLPGSRKGSVAADSRSSEKEQERRRALRKLIDHCIECLRKTKLQVRIGVEIIHCKAAQQMIVEAIDAVRPTLVIVGSRGRGMVKGAIGGSFSRYLIMKSSVPVMTARMKPSSRSVGSPAPAPRLDNNLVLRKFAKAKLHELEYGEQAAFKNRRKTDVELDE